jgi:S-adenosylmethionine decarboxylase
VEKVPEVPLKTLEVCMTELDVEASQQFVRTPAFVSSEHTTRETGIAELLPGAKLDDHMFEPCGCTPGHLSAADMSCYNLSATVRLSYK